MVAFCHGYWFVNPDQPSAPTTTDRTEILTTSQEEPEDYPFPLTLKMKNKGMDGSGTATPTLANGNGTSLPLRPADNAAFDGASDIARQ